MIFPPERDGRDPRLTGDRHVERRDVDASRVEAWVDSAGMAQDAHERRGQHDEQDTTGDLADDERVPEPRPSGGRAHAVFERGARIHVRFSERWQHTEGHRCANRQ